MRKSLLAVAALSLALSFTACADKPEKKLIGKWGMDVQAALASEKFTKMPDEQKEFAKKMIEEMGSKMIFEFQEGGKIHMEMGDMKEDGEWTVKSAEGDKLTLHTKGGKDNKEEDVVVTLKDGKMTMNMKGEDVVFIRK